MAFSEGFEPTDNPDPQFKVIGLEDRCGDEELEFKTTKNP